MRVMNEWREHDCNDLKKRSPKDNCLEFCDISTFDGMSKLGFTYLMHTFGRRLLHYPPVRNHVVYDEIAAFLLKENYFEFPLPKATLYFLDEVWRKHNGDKCIAGMWCVCECVSE